MRSRRTKAQIEQLRRQMVAVLAADHPQSIRHVFYRMTDPRLPEPVKKSDKGYTTVQRQLVHLRRSGEIPYGWITDSTRRGFFIESFIDQRALKVMQEAEASEQAYLLRLADAIRETPTA